MNSSSFKIYNASAGSGKTYTLVKEYLKILFTSKDQVVFKNILAITFTNKAVGEMKSRVIQTLKRFSYKDVLTIEDSMFDSLCNELSFTPDQLHEKSKKLLNSIINNYASLNISTIDGFVHRVIRTFAHDLKLPLNFEVELDQDALLTEAVDALIAKAGNDEKLTKLLVDFATEKADDDKSWDITYDFNNIAKLLFSENDLPFLEDLKHKNAEDFNALKNNLIAQINDLEQRIKANAQSVLTLITESGLQFEDFSRKTLPNHFLKASQLNLLGLYNNKLEENLTENIGLYSSKAEPSLIEIIDLLIPQLRSSYLQQKKDVFQLKFLKAFYKNITPLSVLNAISKTLEELKTENNKLLISEFNGIISKQIKDQPTPFIYERLGEKFKHYFIDEFQDTSKMQWQNLIALIDNALSSENGSAMLVGDAKQSIYRWRGGKPEQFINLFNKTNEPFQIKQKVKSLDSNYRSFQEIVNFNNTFFKFLAKNVFSNTIHEELYLNSYQNTQKEKSGYVNIRFMDIHKGQNKDEVYPEVVLQTINNCINNGYELKDICVLIRRKKEGIAIANYLSKQNLKIISSETLLISQSPKISFINNVIKLLLNPNNNEIKIAVLYYLSEQYNIEDKHAFFKKHVSIDLVELFKSFKKFNIYTNPDYLLSLSLYDLTETILREFHLCETSDAYIQFYLDLVYEYVQKNGSDINGFINYFEEKKEKLSIISPEGQDAVQIMTIHKSKGLEFPVVIFPYADVDIYQTLESKVWHNITPTEYQGFSHALINYSQDLENYSETGKHLYLKHRSQQELDNINLLYVTLTRPIEQLFIISKKDVSSKGIESENTFSGLFISYLKHLNLWSLDKMEYEFGNPEKPSIKKTVPVNISQSSNFISTAKEDHQIKIVTNSSYLWDASLKEAIEKGNLVHNMMAKIFTKSDIPFVIEEFVTSLKITNDQTHKLEAIITAIVDHPKLKNYYTLEHTIINERDIISNTGELIRPDRLLINLKNEVVIIDYKTGKLNKTHQEQLLNYQYILEQMGYTVLKRILVYINNELTVKEV